MRRASIVRFAMISLVLGAGVFLYVAALQTSETVRFEFGSMDWDFLGNPEAFEKRNRMDGPIRYPDGSVEVIQFYGRIALDNAEIRLPYSPLLSFIIIDPAGMVPLVALRRTKKPGSARAGHLPRSRDQWAAELDNAIARDPSNRRAATKLAQAASRHS